MSNVARVAGQAANTLAKPLELEQVFSTYLYDGNGAQNLTVTNGIDLAGEGGMVWYRRRDGAENNSIEDTVRGLDKVIYTDSTNAEANPGAYGLQAFNSDGFTAGYDTSGGDYVTWTFRKAPKFFDIVTYTGDGSTSTSINHNLGVKPGFIAIKTTNTTGNWICWARIDDSNYAISSNPSTSPFGFGTTNSANSNTSYSGTVNAANATSFTPAAITGGYVNHANANNNTYVAYLFAHNDGDGEFGPDADADIIKCGSYTGNGSSTLREIDLGFEPQWVMVKRTDSTSDWAIMDNMRGALYPKVGQTAPSILEANTTDSETATIRRDWGITANGIGITDNHASINASGGTYIYIAIRRPTAVPESATEVFKTYDLTSASLNTLVSTSFPPDMSLHLSNDGNKLTVNRLTGGIHANSSNNSPRNWLQLYGNDAEDTGNYGLYYAFNSTSFKVSNNGYSGQSDSPYAYMWKRAPNYFDLVAYSGNSTAGRTVNHNLGVAPEMFWIKNRTHGAEDWIVYHKDIGNGKYLILHDIYGEQTDTSNARLHGTNPSATNFTLGSNVQVNASGDNYIAYLFASLGGISKVGSYTGNGSNQTINCGFSSGARWILIKRTDSTVSTGNWYVWDTERGIVAGDEQHTVMNTATGKGTDDSIDPENSGFIVNQISATNINVSSAEYIFYAIA